MKRPATTILVFALFCWTLAACTTKEENLQAPSSTAYERLAASARPDSPGTGTDAAAGQAGLSAPRPGGPAAPAEGDRIAPPAEGDRIAPRGTGGKAGAPRIGQPQPAREMIVQPAREPAARPIVPAFPVAMKHKVLADLRTVNFGYDSHTLSAEAKRVLDGNAGWMRAHAKVVVNVVGHADERGTSEYNLALGIRRANRVRDYLIHKGVSGGNLVSVSYGEEVPLSREHNAKAWGMNRRAEFSLGRTTASLAH